ncbi:hypothetical protein [Streptomyces orinoci]|uniref:hypothetical protein n=1 Tax=Streptomyces orinoci TaxID=67339 RepID=UPI00137ADD94
MWSRTGNIGALALDDQAPAVGQHAGDIRAQVAGAAHPLDVRTAVAAAQLRTNSSNWRPSIFQVASIDWRGEARPFGQTGLLRSGLAPPGLPQTRDDDGPGRHGKTTTNSTAPMSCSLPARLSPAALLLPSSAPSYAVRVAEQRAPSLEAAARPRRLFSS